MDVKRPTLMPFDKIHAELKFWWAELRLLDENIAKMNVAQLEAQAFEAVVRVGGQKSDLSDANKELKAELHKLVANATDAEKMAATIAEQEKRRDVANRTVNMLLEQLEGV